jgi:O-acetyl-ADP-ribose deacetylase (regulator of RNase III)
MIEDREGSIFDAAPFVDALVCPVNCVGVAGKGLALEFAKRYPENDTLYRTACRMRAMQIGFVFATPSYTPMRGPRERILYFPTKAHWRSKSRYLDIHRGLADLVRLTQALDLSSLAIPALGCGLGGLEWGRVRPMIEEAFEGLPGVHVLLFGPQEEVAK